MAIPKIIAPINDFSAGEVDVAVKRADLGIVKVGARQMSNWRILNSHKKVNRPGRRVLAIISNTAVNGRVEEILMPNNNVFFIGFATAAIGILNAAGTLVFAANVKGDGTTPIPWTTASAGGITYAIIGKSIYITYPDGAPSNVPQVLTWDGVSQTSTWTLSTYAEAIASGGQKRTAFYRIAAQGITLLPSATTGVVNITFSQNVLSAGMIGTRIRYCDRQLQIKTVSSPTSGTATVIEPLPPAQVLTLTTPTGSFNTGDVVNGSISGAEGIVAISPTVQMLFGILAGPPTYNVGDSVTGGTSGATGTITQVAFSGYPFPFILVQLSTSTFFTNGETVTDNTTSATFTANTSAGTATTMTVQLLPSPSGTINAFTTSDTVVGPSGNSKISSVANASPQAVSVWDQEVMNAFNGYPSSVFADQARLGFCNIPVLPSGIIWSAVSLPNDLYTGAQPDDSIFELAPDQSQVFYVVAGMESSEFVFADRAIYYLPINASNPLKPGSIAFNKLSDYGSLPNVQPRRAEQSVIYIKAGGACVGAVQAPGAYYRPYVVDNISEMHSHLFTAALAKAIAIPSGPSQFEELYIYVALANGALAIGHYGMRNGLLEPGSDGKPSVGWVPWSGLGQVGWIAARGSDVIFTSAYVATGTPYTDEMGTPYTTESGMSVYTTESGASVTLVEILDANQYLDAAVFVNNLPTALTPPGGKGPLWWLPSGQVFLIDLGTRFMGIYNIDANGFILPQYVAGENLASPQLIAGQPWTALYEPFIPHAPGGASQLQRMRRRKIAKALVSVENSSGFLLAKFDPETSVTFGVRRVPYYFVGEDATQPAPLREDSYQVRPQGRDYDPRFGMIKDTPGPITVVEYGIEVTI